MSPIEAGPAQARGAPSSAVLGVPPGGAAAIGSPARSLGLAGRPVSVTAAVFAILALAGVSVVHIYL